MGMCFLIRVFLCDLVKNVTEFVHIVFEPIISISVYCWKMPVIPYISLSKMRFGFSSLSELQWKYWIIMTGLGYITMTGYTWHLQRALNYLREYCSCDFIHVIRKSDTVEALSLFATYMRSNNLNADMGHYFMCRSLCP
jgi:hypothetical protein